MTFWMAWMAWTFDPKYHLRNAVSNVISQLTFGKRFDYDEHALFDLMGELNDVIFNLKISFICGFRWWKALLHPHKIQYCISIHQKHAVLPQTIAKLLPTNPEATYCMLEFDQQQQHPTDYIFAFLKTRNNGAGKYFTGKQEMMAANYSSNYAIAFRFLPSCVPIIWLYC